MRTESSNISNLAGTNRMGHTCANQNGELFFIWGGQTAPEASNNLETIGRNMHLWIYETLTGYWCKRTCAGECPPFLSGSTSSLIGQRMFIFGGHSAAHENWLNCLYCLNLDSLTWIDVGSRAKAEPTKPIRSDKCSSWAFEGRLYIFGGYGWSQVEHLLQLQDRQKDLQLAPDHRWPKFGWNNQLVEFEPSSNTWRWPSYSGRCPSARAAHSGALLGDKYFLFGGRDSCQRLNDLYTLDMRSMQWTQIAVMSEPTNLAPLRHLLESEELELEPRGVQESQSISLDASEDEDEGDGELDEQDFPRATTSQEATRLRDELEFKENQHEMYDDEDDDDETSVLERPHNSSLLERWSLASSATNTSASGPNLLDLNCHEIETQQIVGSNLESTDSPSGADEQREGEGGSLQAEAENSSQDYNEDRGQQQQFEQLSRPQVPIGRSFCSFTPISSFELILFGGISSQDKTLDDCWLYNMEQRMWTQLDLKSKQARLWHTAAKTKNNELIIIGGSCSSKVDEFCSDVLTLALEPKSLKRLALDATARSIKMRSINRLRGLPPTIGKLVRLRKQAIALTMRRNNLSRQTPN